jgi:hypothetical protein
MRSVKYLGAATIVAFGVLQGGGAFGMQHLRRDSDPTGAQGGAPCSRVAHEAPSTAGEALLVPRSPVALVLCRYGSLADGSRLTSSTRIRDVRDVRDLAREFDALSRADGISVCANADGSEITAGFSYRHRQGVVVSVELTGCRVARRGTMGRTTDNRVGFSLLVALKRLLTHPRR